MTTALAKTTEPTPIAGSSRPAPIAGSSRPTPIAGSSRPAPIAGFRFLVTSTRRTPVHGRRTGRGPAAWARVAR